MKTPSESDNLHSLVPLPDCSLANTTAGAKRILAEMVGETLTIGQLQQAGREIFHLLIGNLDEPTADGHARLVQIALGEKFTVSANRFTYADELLQATQAQTCDLCIVALNNLVFRDAGNELTQRVTNSLKLIGRLRKAGAKLIIAVTGHIDAPDLPDRVRQAGADAFFFVLCTAGDFRRAFYPQKAWGKFVNEGLELAGCRWCEPDYWQLALWAQELSIRREEVIQRLVKCGTLLHRAFWRFLVSNPTMFDALLGEAVACASDFLGHGQKTPEEILHHFQASFPSEAEHRLQILCRDLGKIESRIKGLQQLSAERPAANHAYLRTICENLSKADSLTDDATDWKALGSLASYSEFVSEFQSRPNDGTPLHIHQLCLRADILPIGHFTFVNGLQIEALACVGDGVEVLDVRPLQKLETLSCDQASTLIIKRDDQNF